MEGLLTCVVEVLKLAVGLYSLMVIIVWVLLLMMVKEGNTQGETNRQLARAAWLAVAWPLVFLLCVKGSKPLDLLIQN